MNQQPESESLHMFARPVPGNKLARVWTAVSVEEPELEEEDPELASFPVLQHNASFVSLPLNEGRTAKFVRYEVAGTPPPQTGKYGRKLRYHDLRPTMDEWAMLEATGFDMCLRCCECCDKERLAKAVGRPLYRCGVCFCCQGDEPFFHHPLLAREIDAEGVLHLYLERSRLPGRSLPSSREDEPDNRSRSSSWTEECVFETDEPAARWLADDSDDLEFGDVDSGEFPFFEEEEDSEKEKEIPEDDEDDGNGEEEEESEIEDRVLFRRSCLVHYPSSSFKRTAPVPRSAWRVDVEWFDSSEDEEAYWRGEGEFVFSRQH